MEHHSNFVPWHVLARETGATLEVVPVDDDGLLRLEVLDELLATGTVKVVAVAHVSNVVGTINPIADIAARAHAAGAVVVVDGAQAVPQMAVDVGALDADFYAWTGHKAYGPTGVGVLHGRRALLDAMPPFLGGGHMISNVTVDEIRWAEVPAQVRGRHVEHRRGDRAGRRRRLPLRDRDGRGARARARPHRLRARAPRGGARRERSTGRATRTHAARSSPSRWISSHPHDVAEILGSRGVCVRAGHHCAQPLMKRLGVGATTRASFAVHNSRDDIDALIDGLDKVRRVFAWTAWTPCTARRSSSTTSALTTGARWRIPDLEFEDTNPLCGDELRVTIRVDGEDRVEDLRFSGHGCAISQAAASMVSDEVKGMPVKELLRARPLVHPRPARHRHLRDAHEVRAAVAEGAQERGAGRGGGVGACDARLRGRGALNPVYGSRGHPDSGEGPSPLLGIRYGRRATEEVQVGRLVLPTRWSRPPPPGRAEGDRRNEAPAVRSPPRRRLPVSRLSALAAHPRRTIGALAVVLAAVGITVGSGANFTAHSANPANTFTAGTLAIGNSAGAPSCSAAT